ncbi:MAG TPA: hypothetical protein VLM05_21365 [Mycobacteriales bacterium]|nr:hypothetical protein [Mycobacteriales bacterium]
MPELIRAGHGLPTLRVVLERVAGTGDRPEEHAVLQATVGDEPPRPFYRCPTEELGLPDRIDAVPESAFRLPAAAAAAIAAAVAEMDATGVDPGALWLELPPPHGDLHLVPWERLLAPVVTDRPVLRVPYHTLRPRRSHDVFQVAVAATASQAGLPRGVDLAAIVSAYARSWADSSKDTARVHVFVRDEIAAGVRRGTAGLDHVVVHDPAMTADLAGSGAGSSISPADLSTNPWLQWMSAALGGEAVDVLHVLTYGNLSSTGGRLLLARSPIAGGDRDACLLVGCTPLAGAQAQLGSWALVLSGLPGDPSPAALRDLADAIAQLRPGVSVAEAVPEHGTADFDAAVARVFGHGPAVPSLPSLSCWVHPELVHYTAQQAGDLLLTPTGQSAVIAPATGSVLAGESTPAWVAAGSRFLETQQADWIGSASVPPDPAAAEALRSVSALIDAHVTKHVLAPRGEEDPS